LSLFRQRGISARDSKALRDELQFLLPPGYCWNEIGQIEVDPDERVSGAIRLLFDKFQEFGSARQVLLWAQDHALQLPIARRSSVCMIEWRRRPSASGPGTLGHDPPWPVPSRAAWSHSRQVSP
jgi:hypothetical protein